VELEHLPLTANGKLDRRALPAPEWGGREYAAPEGEVEQVIAEIFGEVLKLERVGRADNFFELGGHSLRAMRLISQLRERLEVELPVRALFEQPTVQGLAQRVVEQRADTSSSFQKQSLATPAKKLPLDTLLPLRQSGHLPPLFCIHPAGGLSFPYTGLVHHVPNGHPVYGLQARSYTDLSQEPNTLEEMAVDYLAEIQTLQPFGPYFILGWSFGGLVAFEIATRLEAAGETVALVALLDSYPRTESFTPQAIDDRDRNLLEMILRALDYDETTIAGRLQTSDHSTIAKMLKEDGHFPDMNTDDLESLFSTLTHTFETNVRLDDQYQPTHSLRAEMTLFVALQDHHADVAQSWQPHLAGPLDVHALSTTHEGVLQPAFIAQVGSVIAKKITDTTKTLNIGRSLDQTYSMMKPQFLVQ
jgi:thioesterase domain-containing protein/acyl carrier protein